MPWLTKSRVVPAGRDYQTNFPTVTHYRTARSVDKWLALSGGHYGYPTQLGSGKNIGGAFVLRGADTVHSPSENTEYWRGGPNDQHYKGMFFANIAPYSQPSLTVASMLGSSYAAEAFAKMKPTQPEFSALNSLYELREMPQLFKADYHKRGLRGVADYNLAIQFGWIPLLSDIRNFVLLQRKMQERLAQLLRDNGRPVRRRITLKDESSPNAVSQGYSYSAFQPVLVTQYYASQPHWKTTTFFRERVWASAQFRYWLPGGPRDIEYKRRLIRALYGFRVTPDVIYNMIPWSWLTDWFSNLGYLIENLDYAGVAERLAADYFYLMRSQEWSMEYVASGQFKRRNGSTFSARATATTRAFAKSRVKGGPFDIALKEKDLSATQLGILGSLGLSRLPDWSV